MEPSADRSPDSRTPEYATVGGWLILLCISLAVISPLFTLLNLVQGIQGLRQNWGSISGNPALVGYYMFAYVTALFLVGFSIFAGVKLWFRDRAAVRIAKTYFAASVFIKALLIPISVLLPLSSDLKNKFLISNTFYAGQILIFSTIWYLYLTFSERVRRTYGAAGASPRE